MNLTITKKNNTAVPSAKKLFEYDLGDPILRSLIDQMSEGMDLSAVAAGNLEISDHVAHNLGGLRPSLQALVGMVSRRPVPSPSGQPLGAKKFVGCFA